MSGDSQKESYFGRYFTVSLLLRFKVGTKTLGNLPRPPSQQHCLFGPKRGRIPLSVRTEGLYFCIISPANKWEGCSRDSVLANPGPELKKIRVYMQYFQKW